MWKHSKLVVVVTLVLVSALAWWAGAERRATDAPYRVVDVLDGDTIVVRRAAATTRPSGSSASTHRKRTIPQAGRVFRSRGGGVHESAPVREARHARRRRRTSRRLRAPPRVRPPPRREVQRRVAAARVRTSARDRPQPRARARHARRGARGRAPASRPVGRLRRRIDVMVARAPRSRRDGATMPKWVVRWRV